MTSTAPTNTSEDLEQLLKELARLNAERRSAEESLSHHHQGLNAANLRVSSVTQKLKTLKDRINKILEAM